MTASTAEQLSMGTPARTRTHDGQPAFGAFLRYLRRRARLTQRELAVAVNYSEGQICRTDTLT